VLRAFRGTEPVVADSAYVDPAATVIGDVTVGPEATVLPGAVLRDDLEPENPMFHVADRYARHVAGLEPVDGDG